MLCILFGCVDFNYDITLGRITELNRLGIMNLTA
jgi:hypothetical protein